MHTERLAEFFESRSELNARRPSPRSRSTRVARPRFFEHSHSAKNSGPDDEHGRAWGAPGDRAVSEAPVYRQRHHRLGRWLGTANVWERNLQTTQSESGGTVRADRRLAHSQVDGVSRTPHVPDTGRTPPRVCAPQGLHCVSVRFKFQQLNNSPLPCTTRVWNATTATLNTSYPVRSVD